MTIKDKIKHGMSGVPLAGHVLRDAVAEPWTPPKGALQWLGDPMLNMTENVEHLARLADLGLLFHRWDFTVGPGLKLAKHPFKRGRTEIVFKGDWIVPAGVVGDDEHLECAGAPIVRVFAADGTERLTQQEIIEARNERVLALGRRLDRTSDDDLRVLADIELRRELGEDVAVSPEMFGAVASDAE